MVKYLNAWHTIDMNVENIKEEILNTFEFIAKPKQGAFVAHRDNCSECQYLREAMDSYNEMELPPQALRYLHTELSCLSAVGFQWVFPSYLRYCVSDVAILYREDHLETEFLIYHLSPELKFQSDLIRKLSILESNQINCLISFIEWCQGCEWWAEYCPDNLSKAHDFLMTMRKP